MDQKRGEKAEGRSIRYLPGNLPYGYERARFGPLQRAWGASACIGLSAYQAEVAA